MRQILLFIFPTVYQSYLCGCDTFMGKVFHGVKSLFPSDYYSSSLCSLIKKKIKTDENQTTEYGKT